MALQDNRFAVLISCRSFLDNNHVVQLILIELQISCFCKINEPVAELFCVAGSMGNLADRFEVLKNFFRF